MNNQAWQEEAWAHIVKKVEKTSKRIQNQFPHASVGGVYQLEPASWWTAGFWPGLLWLVYRDTKDERLSGYAKSCEQQLDQVILDYEKLDHDIGFMWILTSVARYKLQGDGSAKRKALLAANLLSARFNLKGNYIRAWNPWNPSEDNAGWAIIDCMMNLSLLFWASQETGDLRYKHIAEAHANTVLEHFIRPDGSVNHIVRFDPLTGEKLEVIGGQGYAPNSAWSRGTSWALYGLALAFHYTNERKYLEASKRVAHFFIANLPEDYVPHWDFRLPESIARPRDSSAGACAASGLLLLSRLVPVEEQGVYRRAAENMLYSLYTCYGTWEQPEEEGLLLHGTSHFPEQRNVDVPLIYGDYFFAEAIAQLNGHTELFW